MAGEVPVFPKGLLGVFFSSNSPDPMAAPDFTQLSGQFSISGLFAREGGLGRGESAWVEFLKDPDPSREKKEVKVETLESFTDPRVSFALVLSVSASPHVGEFVTGGSALGGLFEPWSSVCLISGVLEQRRDSVTRAAKGGRGGRGD